MKKIKTEIQLRFNDMDMLGHLYNGQYQHLYDIGKSDYFQNILGVYNVWHKNGEAFLTASTSNSYFSSVELYEPIIIETQIEKVGNKSFTFYQQMINSQTNQVKSESRTTMVFYNNITKQSQNITPQMRELMEE